MCKDKKLDLAIMMLDIVRFSKKYSDCEQYKIIESLSTTFRDKKPEIVKDLFRYIIPTGDGFIAANKKEELNNIICFFFGFLTALNELKPKIIKILGKDVSFRVAFHVGQGIEFKDVRGNPNLVGSGLNDTKRIIDCAKKDQILISRKVCEEIKEKYTQQYKFDPYIIKVKHRRLMKVYNVYSKEIGNKKWPKCCILKLFCTKKRR